MIRYEIQSIAAEQNLSSLYPILACSDYIFPLLKWTLVKCSLHGGFSSRVKSLELAFWWLTAKNQVNRLVIFSCSKPCIPLHVKGAHVRETFNFSGRKQLECVTLEPLLSNLVLIGKWSSFRTNVIDHFVDGF